VSNQTKKAILKAAIIPPETLEELKRWGMEVPEDIRPEPNLRRALDGIQESVESKELVEFRLTHLDALSIYERGQQKGRLYYAMPDNSKFGEKKTKTTFVAVTYAIMPSGDYLIPWTDEDISDLIVDRGTYLKPASGKRVYFKDVSSHFYGEQKAFMVCRPATNKDEKEEL
jgi:hypothetical protein